MELLAKCYLADTEEIDHDYNGFFQNRLDFIESSRKIIESIRSLGPNSFELYRELSAHWVHMTRLERLVTAVSERGRLPTYGIIVPINYDQEDIPDIVELTQCVKKLRKLVSETIENWERNRRFPSADITLPTFRFVRSSRFIGNMVRIDSGLGSLLRGFRATESCHAELGHEDSARRQEGRVPRVLLDD